MVDFFIQRPIFAAVCALLIILAGAVCIPTLPVSLYPDLAPPQVTVTSNYVGANAQVVESAVTIPLEQQINGVEGMHYITSTSSNDGTSAINVIFRTGYDLNIAAVDVQNRVATAQGRLPQEIKNTGVTITKANPNFVFAAGFYSPDNSLSNQYISNYLDVYVKDALKRIPGVGDVIIFGERKYAMRIWLDPTRLAARQLTAADVVAALQEQNVEIAAGQLGRPPADQKQDFQVALRVIGRLSDPKQFENIILKNTKNGIVQLKDVGRAEIGAESYDTNLLYSGHEAVGVGVQQLSNANALEVDKAARAKLEELSKSFPPGIKYVIAFDTTTVVGDSVREVVTTLEEAILIVIVVIFFFLLDWRATIIPAVTIPVSLIGTFAFIKVFGFSINSLTLFGITLATGLVVDDAIVVIENAQRHINEDKIESAHGDFGRHERGVRRRNRDVPGADFGFRAGIVLPGYDRNSVPVSSRSPSLSRLRFRLFNALTLSPALAAIASARRRAQVRSLRLDRNRMAFARLPGVRARCRQDDSRFGHRAYGKADFQGAGIRYANDRAVCSGLAATAYMYIHVPLASCRRKTRTTSSWWCSRRRALRSPTPRTLRNKAEQILRADPDVFGTFAVPGFSLSGGSSSNYGLVFAPLKPIDDRKGKGHAASDIVARVSPKLFGIPGAIVVAFEPPAINGLGSFGGFQFQLQDLGRNTLEDLDNGLAQDRRSQPPATRSHRAVYQLHRQRIRSS